MDRSAEPAAGPSRRLWPLGRDQVIVLVCLAALTALAAGWLLDYSANMGRTGASAAMRGVPPMRGMAMAGMSADPQLVTPYALLAAMWGVMMAGMMLPSATPMILLYAAVQRKGSPWPLARTGVFVLGYLLIWTAFALAASALQKLLAERALITPAMALTSRRISGGVLILAGVYEVTPLKQDCLRYCRGPVAFITSHWRQGFSGAFRMGIRHGLYCTGCCWALMLLLFVGGVMSFAWIVGLAALILVQKLVPGGGRAAAVTSWAIAVAAGTAGALAVRTAI
jgi:predicted metal-binding membrane protein